MRAPCAQSSRERVRAGPYVHRVCVPPAARGPVRQGTLRTVGAGAGVGGSRRIGAAADTRGAADGGGTGGGERSVADPHAEAQAVLTLLSRAVRASRKFRYARARAVALRAHSWPACSMHPLL